eukprot:gb/GFBE01053829.1/.p1 GENE.gb/GFBE01053829.1/~~gb/GFBE01053829.1/.p1  ORF type:complete len:159 (+),score=42.04 gb/GFBE01053829.1/:1-477(+)
MAAAQEALVNLAGLQNSDVAGKLDIAESSKASLSTTPSERDMQLLEDAGVDADEFALLETEEDITPAAVAAYASGASRGHEVTVSRVTALLEHASWEVRVAAVETLPKVAKPGDRQAMAAITTCMMHDADSIVRYAAWEVLGEMEAESGWGGSNSPRL